MPSSFNQEMTGVSVTGSFLDKQLNMEIPLMAVSFVSAFIFRQVRFPILATTTTLSRFVRLITSPLKATVSSTSNATFGRVLIRELFADVISCLAVFKRGITRIITTSSVSSAIINFGQNLILSVSSTTVNSFVRAIKSSVLFSLVTSASSNSIIKRVTKSFITSSLTNSILSRTATLIKHLSSSLTTLVINTSTITILATIKKHYQLILDLVIVQGVVRINKVLSLSHVLFVGVLGVSSKKVTIGIIRSASTTSSISLSVKGLFSKTLSVVVSSSISIIKRISQILSLTSLTSSSKVISLTKTIRTGTIVLSSFVKGSIRSLTVSSSPIISLSKIPNKILRATSSTNGMLVKKFFILLSYLSPVIPRFSFTKALSKTLSVVSVIGSFAGFGFTKTRTLVLSASSSVLSYLHRTWGKK